MEGISPSEDNPNSEPVKLLPTDVNACSEVLSRVLASPSRNDCALLEEIFVEATGARWFIEEFGTEGFENSLLAMKCIGKLVPFLVASLADSTAYAKSDGIARSRALELIVYGVECYQTGLLFDWKAMEEASQAALVSFASAGDALVGAQQRWPKNEIEVLSGLVVASTCPENKAVLVQALRGICFLACKDLARF
jgi:hypothetical protein